MVNSITLTSLVPLVQDFGGFPRDLLGAPGDQVGFNVDQKRGGNSIEYRDEDPQIRKDYIEALKKEGAEFQMPESVYQ
jgi:hypothetical protein